MNDNDYKELLKATRGQITPLKGIYAEGELDEAATCKDCLQVRMEGGRKVSRQLRHYRLEAKMAGSSISSAMFWAYPARIRPKWPDSFRRYFQ